MDKEHQYYYEQIKRLQKRIQDGEVDINDVLTDDLMRQYREIEANERTKKD